MVEMLSLRLIKYTYLGNIKQQYVKRFEYY